MASAFSARGECSIPEAETQRSIESAFYEVDASMSNWSQTSEVSRFDCMPVGESMAMSQSLEIVLGKSVDVYEKTEGLFDPAIGELIEAWGFGVNEIPRAAWVRSQARVDSGWNGVTRRGGRWIRSKPVTLNVSGIAKGYAVDLALSRTVSKCERLLIDLGGEVGTKGSWTVAVRHPGDKNRTIGQVDVTDAAVATSGTYANSRTLAGVRFSHILHPRTGEPVRALLSVTVVGPDGAYADALATALVLAFSMNDEDRTAGRILARFPAYSAIAVRPYSTHATGLSNLEEGVGSYAITIAGLSIPFKCTNPAASRNGLLLCL